MRRLESPETAVAGRLAQQPHCELSTSMTTAITHLGEHAATELSA